MHAGLSQPYIEIKMLITHNCNYSPAYCIPGMACDANSFVNQQMIMTPLGKLLKKHEFKVGYSHLALAA